MTADRDERSSPRPNQRAGRRAGQRAERSPAAVTAAVRPLVDGVANELGLVVWAVTFLRSAGRETLRVAVDRPGGIGSDELAAFAERLSRELDRNDPVPGDRAYVLETTSPGAERKLERPEQFRVCIGRRAKVVLRDGRSFEGEIAGCSDRAVELRVGDDDVRALFDDIAKAQLVVRI